MTKWMVTVGLALCAACGVSVMAQARTHDDKAVVNGAPKDTNAGVFRLASLAQDAGKSGGVAAAAVNVTPAMWRVKGPRGTLFLFGTIHVMKPGVDWETAKVKSAFDASDTVYMEVANLDDQAAAVPLMASAMDAAHPLSTKIAKDDVTLLDRTVKGLGMPGEAMFEPMQPWMAGMTVSLLLMTKAGYDPASGIDTVLLGQARQAGKKVEGFETMEQQMHFLADEPEAEQVTKLHEELAEMDKNAAEMGEMVAAWERGDVEKIATIENGELKTKYPAEYKTLVVERNAKWAEKLDGMLNDPATGTVFVAVGAAHLAGDDSVIELLKKDGWKVERE